VHVVVVVDQFLDDRRRPFQAGARAYEHLRGSSLDEPCDEILRQLAVDLPRDLRRALSSVPARVVNVDVEPVLVRGVPEPSEPRAEVSAVRPGDVADPDTRRLRMRGRVLAQHAQERPNQTPVAIAAPTAVRRAPAHRVPGEEVRPFGREPDAAHERAVPRDSQRARAWIGARGTAGQGRSGCQAERDPPQGHAQTYAESIA
jgi:hypothetical protein